MQAEPPWLVKISTSPPWFIAAPALLTWTWIAEPAHADAPAGALCPPPDDAAELEPVSIAGLVLGAPAPPVVAAPLAPALAPAPPDDVATHPAAAPRTAAAASVTPARRAMPFTFIMPPQNLRPSESTCGPLCKERRTAAQSVDLSPDAAEFGRKAGSPRN